MPRFLILSAIGLGVLFAAFAPTFVPTPASAYYYYYPRSYYYPRYYGFRPFYRHRYYPYRPWYYGYRRYPRPNSY